MARRSPKNPINDISDAVGAWLGGNRGSVPSSGAGAAWQASARSAAQSANRRIVEGLEEGVVQFGALGMGTSAQAQRDLMYGVPGAGTQAAKEAAVSYVTGAAVGYGVGKVAGKVVQSGLVVNPVAAVRNFVKGERVIVHGTANVLKGKTLYPTAGSNYSAIAKGNEQMVFGFNPRDKGALNTVAGGAEYYAGRTFNEATGLPIQNPQYNVVVGKAQKKAVTNRPGAGQGVVTSSAPVEISGVVKSPSPQGSVTYDQYVKALQREIRKAGSSLRGEESRLAKRVNEIRRSRKLRNAPGVS